MLTLTQAAEQLGVTSSNLRQALARGRLHAERIGPIWVVSQDEVDRYRRDSLGQAGWPRKKTG
jgi:excisionase family DNA binding protein